jgi:hypothetical protein
MLTRINKNYSFGDSSFRVAVFLLIFLFLFVISASAQNPVKKNLPAWQGYKGVSIGMTAAQVREKLGAAKSEDAEGFFYMFSDTETAQFMLDANKNVRTISVVFAAENAAPPTFADVFGKAAAAEPKPDGSIYKMVRFEDAGYWVSYSRMAGDKAMVIVTIQKL